MDLNEHRWGDTGGRRVLLREVDRRSGASIPFRIPIDFGEAGALGDFAIAPDGRSLVYLEEAARGEVWVLETDKGRF